MVLFPLAFIWVAAVLIWIIRKGSVPQDETPPPEPRRFRPRGPRRGPGPRETARSERVRRSETRR